MTCSGSVNAIQEHDVFLFDVDGTLARDGETPSEEVVAAVARLLRQGKHVGLVTARGVEEIRDVALRFAQHADSTSIRSQLLYFVSSASAIYRHAHSAGQELELVRAHDGAMHEARLHALTDALGRLPGVEMTDRGAQQTIRTASTAAMSYVRRLLAQHEAHLRVLHVTRLDLHVLPKHAGKHAAVSYYQRTIGAHTSVAFGDGFYDIPELELRGNDMDFVGVATTCIQIGRIKPRNSTVLYLPLADTGPASVLRVLGHMHVLGTRDLALLVAERDSTAGFATELRRCDASVQQRTFVSKLVEYVVTTLDPDDVDRRLTAASAALRDRSLADAIECLARNTPLDRDFGRWAGFEGELGWVLRWLWDEHLARPRVPFASHFVDRVRAPLLPEELAISLVRALPYLNRGHRIVLVGKDAECATALTASLARLCRDHGLIPKDALEPVGIRVCARKSSKPAAIDSAEHLEAGSVARQLWVLLEPEERTQRLSLGARDCVLEAVRALSANERHELAAALGTSADSALGELCLGELIARIASLCVHPPLERFIAFGRNVIFMLNAHADTLVRQTNAPCIESLALTYLPDANQGDVVSAYRASVGRSTVEGARDLAALNRILCEMLGHRYASLRDFEFPFTSVLRALMHETRIRSTLTPNALFLDASFNTGTTVLFLRALRHIIAPEAEFRFAAIGGMILHESLRRDLEWHGHPYLVVLLEEGAPHTFDFFYDDRDERIAYATAMDGLKHSPTGPVPAATHIDAFCQQHAARWTRFADLGATGLEFGQLVRWWLRRDRVWEMRVLCDTIRFRWPYADTVRGQQRAVALFHELDEVVDVETKARLARQDFELRAYETHRVLNEWVERREQWQRRACSFAEAMLAYRAALEPYIASPSLAGWRRLQRVLMTNLRPQ